MTQLDLENLSDSMEMYLVTIARLREGDQPVPLSHLAEALMVTSVSVNEMCRKLQDNGLLIYRPYKGAILTEEGERLANDTLRRHRLWEVFLVEKLHFSREEADAIACDLEHATGQDVIDRLDGFLNYPVVNPRGLPIPQAGQVSTQPIAITLDQLPVGKAGQVSECPVDGPARDFLESYGIRPGMKVQLIAKGQDNVLVEVDGVQAVLSAALAHALQVIPTFFPDQVRDTEREKPGSTQQHSNEVKEMEKSKKVNHIRLNELKKGQQAIIVQVGGKGAVKRRMMDMGIVPGSTISVVRVAPLGDPIEYLIKGYSLSLRRSEAKEILVELLSEDAE